MPSGFNIGSDMLSRVAAKYSLTKPLMPAGQPAMQPQVAQPMQPPQATTAPISQNNPYLGGAKAMGPIGVLGGGQPGPGSGPTAPTQPKSPTGIPSPLPMPLNPFQTGGVAGPSMPSAGTIPPPIGSTTGIPIQSVAASQQTQATQASTPTPMVQAPRPGPVETSTPAAPQPVVKAPSAPAPITSTSTPMQMPTKSVNTKTGETFVNGVKGEGTANKAGEVANPQPTAAPSPTQAVQSSLDEFANVARGWMTGTDDSVFRIAANRVIDQLALLNQAERDAMQMQINQDPSLRGQGAGRAMLEIMARNQNFKAGDVFAQLAQDSRERILDLQKYGWEKGLQVNQERRRRAFEDANTLIKAGNFNDAAKMLQGAFEKEGYQGITVSAESLKSRDAFTIDQFKSRMDRIKELALTDPAAATNMLRIEMANPANRDWFPAGSTPEQFIETLLSTGTADAIEKGRVINSEINLLAASPTSTYAEGANYLKELFRTQRRNAVDEGRKMGLEEVNSLRTELGLGGGFRDDGMGNLVDEDGNLLTDEDYAELAYQKEWQQRTEQARRAPWEVAKELIMKSPEAQKFMDESLFPGAKDALDSYLQSYYLDPDASTIDPKTGLPVPNLKGTELPWNNPNHYHLFYTWPQATFDKSGKVTGKFDPGGDVYGEELADGSKVEATPQDQALDSAYTKYKRGGGTLSAVQWYFATAGGRTNPNPANIPTEYTGGTGQEEDLKVGETPKTIQDEKAQIIASLKPSQKPPDGSYTRTVRKKTTDKGIPLISSDDVTITRNVTEYWNPDTGKYESNPNDAYRALYAQDAKPTTSDGIPTSNSLAVGIAEDVAAHIASKIKGTA